MESRASDNPNLEATGVHVAAPPERQAGKFMYAGGTRPLEGYTIKRGVGQGGFGEIYYALSDAGKEVALKLIRRNLDVELRGIRQCLNLKHPNLLTLFDIRQDDIGDTWVIMEFVSGASLQEALEAHPRGMPVEEALAWIHGLGAAVAYLHDHGIVHRDLKPGNVFSDEGLVKVGDYGLSKFISCSRRSGHTESIGTVHYMAPEVASGRYGKELDVYAMGVVLYEMLTGRVPFEGESVGEILMKHLTAQPDLTPVPEPFRAVLARALEKDPEKRFGSAAEMLAALPACPGDLQGRSGILPLSSGRLPAGNSSRPQGQRMEEPVDAHLVTAEVQVESAGEKSFFRVVPQVIRNDWQGFCHFWNRPGGFRNYPTLHTALKIGIITAVFSYLLISFIAACCDESGIVLLIVPAAFFGIFYSARLIVAWLDAQQPLKRISEKPTVVALPSSRPPSPQAAGAAGTPAASTPPLAALESLASSTQETQRRGRYLKWKIFALMAVILVQYIVIAAAWKEYSPRVPVGYQNGSFVYGTAGRGPEPSTIMMIFLPTVLVGLYFGASWFISRLGKKQWWKVLGVTAVLLVQYFIIAATWAEYGPRRPTSYRISANGSVESVYPGYTRRGLGLPEYMMICLPTVLLGLYGFGSWIVTRTAKGHALELHPEASAPATSPSPNLPDLTAGEIPAAAPAVQWSESMRGRWRRRYEKPLPALVLGTPRQRVTELLGSLLLSAPVAAAVTAVLFLIGSSYQNQPMSVEQLAWLFTVGLAGSWTVLIPAKLWEGAPGDATLRRFMMMVLGLGLGVLACGLAQYLLISDLPHNANLSFWHPGWAGRWFYGENGRPLWPAYAAVFGSLFLLVRWWQLADPMRTARFSLGGLILAVVLAFIAGDAWGFPQPWLPRVAAVVAVSVLLSGRWLGPHERTHPRL